MHRGTLAQAEHYLALRQIRQKDNLFSAGLRKDIVTKVPRHITVSDEQSHNYIHCGSEELRCRSSKPLSYLTTIFRGFGV